MDLAWVCAIIVPWDGLLRGFFPLHIPIGCLESDLEVADTWEWEPFITVDLGLSCILFVESLILFKQDKRTHACQHNETIHAFLHSHHSFL